ncbi:hypothetical protein PTKIN_Ptkin12aG0130600 [Pterospermum kingtungense]
MNRIVQQQIACSKWKSMFCPRIMEKIEHNKEISAFCHVKWNGALGYEVQCHEDRFIVKVEDKKCTCRRWHLTGIPCAHAISVILFRKKKISRLCGKLLQEKCVRSSLYSYFVPISWRQILAKYKNGRN